MNIQHTNDNINDTSSAFSTSRRQRRAIGIAVACVSAFIATTAVGSSASAAYPTDDGPAVKVMQPQQVRPPAVNFIVRKPHGAAIEVSEQPADSSADWYGWQVRAQQSAASIMPRTADFYDRQASAAEAESTPTQMSADRCHVFADGRQ